MDIGWILDIYDGHRWHSDQYGWTGFHSTEVCG